ncbi:MAG: hypothetical protein M0D54_02185 [Hyphomonadaceae bacterium JAD_PAG50586_4]|nr:MAG: hypothetical protein M0D54_02185 [Hyphomonadaceae bacterium JAD_PAG50586_4]
MSESTLALLLDARKAKTQAAAALAKRQRFRLADAVAHAHSPFYREFYGELPERADEGADTRDAAEPSQGSPVRTSAVCAPRSDGCAVEAAALA